MGCTVTTVYIEWTKQVHVEFAILGRMSCNRRERLPKAHAFRLGTKKIAEWGKTAAMDEGKEAFCDTCTNGLLMLWDD